MNFQTLGSLDLISGDFRFATKHFILTKGSVSFSGKTNEMPNLEILAKMNQQGVDVLANLKGPIDSPKLFFTSNPPLAASSIMSLLEFGQALSQLSEDQKVELVSKMTDNLDTSSGATQEDISSLGMERYEPSEQVGLKFGKYVTNGTVVSLSQGDEQGDTNVIIEVDLKKGFIFQAESDEDQEQGKFSIKWRKNF